MTINYFWCVEGFQGSGDPCDTGHTNHSLMIDCYQFMRWWGQDIFNLSL